jgi:type II secretory pathway component PulF
VFQKIRFNQRLTQSIRFIRVQKNNRKAHKVFRKVRKEYYKDFSNPCSKKIRFNQRLTQSIRFIRVQKINRKAHKVFRKVSKEYYKDFSNQCSKKSVSISA